MALSSRSPESWCVGRRIVCDSGRDDDHDCGCAHSWSGLSSHTSTTLAEVALRDITETTYTDLIVNHLISQWWQRDDAEQEARMLADLAADFEPGTLITIDTEDDRHVFEALET